MILMMLSGAGGGNVITHVASFTVTGADSTSVVGSGNALDVFGNGGQVGDLVFITFTSDTGNLTSIDPTPYWQGMAVTGITGPTSSTLSDYSGYHFITGGDSNPYLSANPAYNTGFVCTVSIFRGVSSYLGFATATANSGQPNPPSVTAAGNLWIAVGHLDDDIVAQTPPANYTTAITSTSGSAGNGTSVAVAYRIESLASDDPATFTGGDDGWVGTTVAFS